MKDIHESAKPGRTWLRLIFLIIVMLVVSASASAQLSSSTTTGTPLGMAPGAPAGSYALSGFDTVNPTTAR